MDSNRMETVKRVTSAITGAPARIAIRGARKIDARGVREHFWLLLRRAMIRPAK